MNDVIRTRAMFCDLLNLPRGKIVPTKQAKSGSLGFARGVFGLTYDRDLISVPSCGLYHGIPDMELALEKKRRPGWQARTDIALGDLHTYGAPFALCPRSALKRAVSGCEAKGLVPMVGLELEAYVFRQDAEGVWQPYNTPGAFVYGCGPANDPEEVMESIWEAAYACDLPIESMNGEFDNAQFELTLGVTDALSACDDAFVFRTMAREVAMQKGLLLTFMPKPIPDRGGSGMHINFSFADRNGRNIIAPDGKLSYVANQAIAGLLAHHEGLAGLLAMTQNSYDRLTPGSMAGYWANWADDHRLVSVRSSSANPTTARLEHRTPDCATNPYIAVAAVLQASLLGMHNESELPAQEDLDCLVNTRATRHVPSTLDEAMDALDADALLRTAVGEELCDAILYLKRDEHRRLVDKSVDEVRNFYLPFV